VTLNIDPKRVPPEMSEIFKRMAPDKRITKNKMQHYLAKKYKNELAKNIVEILAPYFSHFNQNLDQDAYVKGINDAF